MKITGVICEYNPFHMGHAYQLAQARELCGEDTAVVCVMSGDFVQRGEPAIVGKHARAEMAVLGGADIVFELPLPWAIGSAERFASGGVALLEAVGADFISFGCECPDTERLLALATAARSEEVSLRIRHELGSGVSYAAARERALKRAVGDEALLLREPNNILAVEYLKAMLAAGSKMVPLAVPRFGARHDGAPSLGVAGASEIRRLLLEGGDPSEYMPPEAFAVLKRETDAGRAPVSVRGLETAVMYALRTLPMDAFQRLPDGSEGLWMRFERFSRTEPTLEAVLDKVKTKRYAHARLRRMAKAALLGVTADTQKGEPPYLRLLAANEKGREALKLIKRRASKPIITKPASGNNLPPEDRRIFRLDTLAVNIYSLAYTDPAQRRGGQDWETSPIML